MEPLTMAAIFAGSKLLEGVLGSRAQRQRNIFENQMQSLRQQQQLEQQGIATANTQQQNALSNLVEAYRSSLLGG